MRVEEKSLWLGVSEFISSEVSYFIILSDELAKIDSLLQACDFESHEVKQMKMLKSFLQNVLNDCFFVENSKSVESKVDEIRTFSARAGNFSVKMQKPVNSPALFYLCQNDLQVPLQLSKSLLVNEYDPDSQMLFACFSEMKKFVDVNRLSNAMKNGLLAKGLADLNIADVFNELWQKTMPDLALPAALSAATYIASIRPTKAVMLFNDIAKKITKAGKLKIKATNLSDEGFFDEFKHSIEAVAYNNNLNLKIFSNLKMLLSFAPKTITWNSDNVREVEQALDFLHKYYQSTLDLKDLSLNPKEDTNDDKDLRRNYTILKNFYDNNMFEVMPVKDKELIGLLMYSLSNLAGKDFMASQKYSQNDQVSNENLIAGKISDFILGENLEQQLNILLSKHESKNLHGLFTTQTKSNYLALQDYIKKNIATEKGYLSKMRQRLASDNKGFFAKMLSVLGFGLNQEQYVHKIKVTQERISELNILLVDLNSFGEIVNNLNLFSQSFIMLVKSAMPLNDQSLDKVFPEIGPLNKNINYEKNKDFLRRLNNLLSNPDAQAVEEKNIKLITALNIYLGRKIPYQVAVSDFDLQNLSKLLQYLDAVKVSVIDESAIIRALLGIYNMNDLDMLSKIFQIATGKKYEFQKLLDLNQNRLFEISKLLSFLDESVELKDINAQVRAFGDSNLMQIFENNSSKDLPSLVKILRDGLIKEVVNTLEKSVSPVKSALPTGKLHKSGLPEVSVAITSRFKSSKNILEYVRNFMSASNHYACQLFAKINTLVVSDANSSAHWQVKQDDKTWTLSLHKPLNKLSHEQKSNFIENQITTFVANIDAGYDVIFKTSQQVDLESKLLALDILCQKILVDYQEQKLRRIKVVFEFDQVFTHEMQLNIYKSQLTNYHKFLQITNQFNDLRH